MGDKAIKQYNQTSETQTGATTDDKDGVLLQRNNQYFWIDPVDLRSKIQRAELTLTAAQVQALFTSGTRQAIVEAQGAGTYIVPLADPILVREPGTAYATQTTLRTKFKSEASDNNYFHTWGSVLAGTAKLVRLGDNSNSYALNTELKENDDFQVFAPASNPTAGTGSITIVLYYYILEA